MTLIDIEVGLPPTVAIEVAFPAPILVDVQVIPGSPGSGGGAGRFEFVQTSPVSSLIITHNLGRFVQCEVFTLGGMLLWCEALRLDSDRIQLSFNTPQAFVAVID